MRLPLFHAALVPLAPGLIGVAEMLPVQIPFVWSYLLVDADGVVLMDTGVQSTAAAVRRWFEKQKRPASDLKAILLTHGHSDHIHGAVQLSRWSGAPIHLHADDAALAAGLFPYGGWSRVGGAIETISRVVFDCRPVRHAEPLRDRMLLPWWGGLQVVHLPGHMPGHVGFFAPERRLLFCGDALLCWGRRTAFPHRIFNWDHREVVRSALKLIDFDADRVYPMHHVGLRHNMLEDVRRFAAKRRSEP